MNMIITGLLLLLIAAASGCCAAPSSGRLGVDDTARFSRWLVGSASWGVLATLRGTAPFGYVASYSDAGTGSPYFCLSALDPAGQAAAVNPLACFTVSERTIDDCGGADPQSPSCAKIALSGKRKLRGDSWEAARAEAALFADHPQFAGFPKNNGSFAVFKLEIRRIFLVNKPAPASDVDVEKYFKIA